MKPFLESYPLNYNFNNENKQIIQLVTSMGEDIHKFIKQLILFKSSEHGFEDTQIDRFMFSDSQEYMEKDTTRLKLTCTGVPSGHGCRKAYIEPPIQKDKIEKISF